MQVRSLTAVDVTLDRGQKKMTIVWGDEHVSEYGFDYLRSACPCAQCDATKHGGQRPTTVLWISLISKTSACAMCRRSAGMRFVSPGLTATIRAFSLTRICGANAFAALVKLNGKWNELNP